MRKARENFDELAGLTIERVFEIDNYRVVTFTDDTYAAFLSIGSEDRSAPELTELDERPYEDETTNLYVESGIWSAKELQAWKDERNERSRRYDAEHALREREQYERLKAKFG